MTSYEKYIELFNKSRLSKTVWGLLFKYGQTGSTAYKVTYDKLHSTKEITTRDISTMSLVETLLENNLLYSHILENIKLSKKSLYSFRRKFFHHVECDCPKCYNSIIEFVPAHVPPDSITIKCPDCEYEFKPPA